MSKQIRNEVFQCSVCGLSVEVLRSASGTLICCGVPMRLMKANTTDAAQEKHVPVIEKTEKGVKITVGEVPHPMEDKHYIEWIELITDTCVARHFLKPGEAPEVEFPVSPETFSVRESCNLHGIWKADS